MVDFLVKKRQLIDEIRWRHYDMAPCRRQLDRLGNSAKHGEKYGGVFGKARHIFRHVFQLRNYYIIKYRHQTLSVSVWGGRPTDMSSAPPPPPTALPVAATVMAAATTTATVTAVGASTATTAAAAATATAVDTNNKQQSTKSGSGRLGGGGGGSDTRTTAATTADGTMALISATTTTAAAVATVAATAAEEVWHRKNCLAISPNFEAPWLRHAMSPTRKKNNLKQLQCVTAFYSCTTISKSHAIFFSK
jgi:hypothetical protein